MIQKVQESLPSISDGIKQTLKLLSAKRMMILIPLIMQSAFNLAIYTGVFVTLMEDTMDDWKSSKKD